MGEVHLAEDTRLGRHVAIKLLPPDFTHADRLHRFEQEARAASALNHPNIITIYEFGQTEEGPFMATEFIDGHTLREKMREPRLPLQEAIRVALQVADALAAAHQAGIFHRDIKPENIMIRRDGWVKVVDFGLAKLSEQLGSVSDESPTLPRIDTLPGVVAGTVHYMSPEQARGVAIDGSTDLFSLGIVLYEMVAGQLPFRGTTATDVVVSILHDEPPSIRTRFPECPDGLDAIVAKALAKQRHERYQSAAEMAADLRRLKQRLEVATELRLERQGSDPPLSPAAVTAASDVPDRTVTRVEDAVAHRRRNLTAFVLFGAVVLFAIVAAIVISYALMHQPPSGPIDTLAVLPFVNATGDPSAEYLSDGMTESLINSLSQLPHLKVMSRSSVWHYRMANAASDPDARAAAKELGVRAVLTGRVTRPSGRLVISAELVDARDSSHIWGERYDSEGSDVLAVEGEIASEIAKRLRVRLSGDDRRAIAKGYPQNNDAYDRYLRGRYFLNKRSAEAIRKGRDFFQQAIEADPQYALAYSGISDSWLLLAAQAAVAPADAYPAGIAAARKAIALDDDLAEGHASLAHAMFHTHDNEAAEREFARASALDPNYAPAYQWRAELLGNSGRVDEAFASTQKALSLEPLDLATNAEYTGLLIQTNQDEKALAQVRKTLEIDPNYFLGHIQLGTLQVRAGRFPEAIREFQEVARLTGGNRGLGPLGQAYAQSGEVAEARRVAEQMEARAKEHYVDPGEAARLYATLHDRTHTLAWIAKAHDANPVGVSSLRKDELFAFLRDDPHFLTLTEGAHQDSPGAPRGR